MNITRQVLAVDVGCDECRISLLCDLRRDTFSLQTVSSSSPNRFLRHVLIWRRGCIEFRLGINTSQPWERL